MTTGAMQDYALTLDKFLTHAAKWHPETEIVTAHSGGQVTRTNYSDLEQCAQSISVGLGKMGVAQGDRVATLAWNTQAHIEAWYAIMGMGAICHTLNPRLLAPQLAEMLNQSQAEILVCSADLLPLARQMCAMAPTVRKILFIDADIADAALIEGEPAADDFALLLDNKADAGLWGNFDEGSPAGLCFTSGTTGEPKGVIYTHRSNYLHTLRLLQADVMAIGARDAVLAVVPMFHANGWGIAFAAPAAGAKLVLPGRKTDGANLARLIAEEGVTIALGVPTVWLGLLDHLDAEGTDIPTLERIIVGGAPMPVSLMKRIEARGINVQTSWGMTELSPLGTNTPPGMWAGDLQTAGRPAIGLDLRLTDAAGDTLANQRGVEGHLWVRGQSVLGRYLGQSESELRDGWFNTNDLAMIDAEGNVQITGRAKDLIKSGGEWINPVEVEAIVSAHPDIALAAVIGRSDPKWGERPLLLVEIRDGAIVSDDDLFALLNGQVASWWIPDEIIRLPEMPLAATGKINKLRLQSEYSRL